MYSATHCFPVSWLGALFHNHDSFSAIYLAMEGGTVSSCLIRLRIKVREIITWLTFLNITKKTVETGVNMT